MTHIPTKKDFWFLPLGGSGEIGMNLNLYGHDGQWLMIDLGVTFGDRFGIDVITPDPEFILAHRDKLAGLVLTHAHEDHVGAIPYLWDELRCPLYATAFTANVIRQKVKDLPWGRSLPLTEVPLSGKVKIGSFDVEFITLTHSIPEPNAIAISTPLGTVVHTGDWKIDPEPLVGNSTNHTRLSELGDQGVLAMVCDSTNVFTEGTSGSEEAVRQELKDLIKQYPDKRIFVACFASNIARVETAVIAAQEQGRQVALVGRSLERMVKAAQEAGYLTTLPSFIDENKAMKLPAQEVMVISTGSQGEPRAALSRIAADQHPIIKLDHNDVVVFSSRVIPGNEKSISILQNNLVRKGVKVITSHEEDIHVSGHPAREELKQMYEWVRPHLLIPVHGEIRHMQEQAELGLSCGVPKALVPENGTLVRLDRENPAIIDVVPTGRLGYDGNRMVPMISPLVRDRARLGINGSVFVSITLDKAGQLAKVPLTTFLGVCLEGEEMEQVDREVHKAIRQTIHNGYKNGEALKEELRIAIRRTTNTLLGKKPVVEIHIS